MQPASSSLDARRPDLVAVVSAAIDLEATARVSGALVRRRAMRSAEMLLRLALAYGPGGLSLRSAAAWAGVHGLADLSDTAVMKRLRKAADWLGEIAGALLPPPRGGRAADPGPAAGATAADRGWQHDHRPRWQAEVATARHLRPGRRPLHGPRAHRRARRRAFRPDRLAAGRCGARRPLLRPSTGAAPDPGRGSGFHRAHRLDPAAPAGRGGGAAGVGADLRRLGRGRGRRAGGLGGPLR